MKKLYTMALWLAALASAPAAMGAPTIYGGVYFSNEWSSGTTFVNKRGVYSFNPTEDSPLTAMTPAGEIAVSITGAYADGIYYWLDGTYSDKTASVGFNKLSTDTWQPAAEARHFQGETKTVAYGMAYDYTTSTMFAASPVIGKDFSICMLRKVNLETGEFTDVAQFDRIFRAICVDAKGQMFGFERESAFPYKVNLYSIDKTTGQSTFVGNTGINSQSTTFSAAYDLTSGKIYYAGTTFTYNEYYEQFFSTIFMEIDPATGTATEARPLHYSEQITSLFFIDNNPVAPAAASDLTFTFNSGDQNQGTVSCVAPTTTYTGEALSGNLSVEFYVDGEKASTKNRQKPGATVSAALNLAGTALHKVSAVVVSGDYRSLPIEIEVYSGEDKPAPVTNIKTELSDNDATITLSWTPAETGAQGGYVNPENLTYKIVRRPDWVTVAEGITETSFTDSPEYNMQMTQYEIYAIGAAGTSEVARTATMTIGKPYGTNPYLQTFDNATAFYTFTTIDVDNDKYGSGDENDGNVWLYDSANKYAIWWLAYGGPRRGANDWIISPTLELSPDNVYRVSFDSWGLSGTLAQMKTRLTLCSGSAATAEAMTNTIIIDEYDGGGIKRSLSKLFIPKEGDCRIGLHAWNTGYDHIVFDNFRVALYGPNTIPGECTDITTTKKDGAINISFKAPATNAKGDEISSLKAIYLYRMDTQALVGKIDNPEPGKEYTIKHADPAYNENFYLLFAENEFGEGLESDFTCDARPDAPKAVENFVAKFAARGAEAELSWNYPADMLGVNGIKLEDGELTFNVYRTVLGHARTQIAAGLTQSTFTDAGLASVIGSRQQADVTYSVEAVTDKATSEMVSYQDVFGTTYELPAYESFPSRTPNYSPWRSANGSMGFWTPADPGYDPRVDAYDNDGGLISFMPSGYGYKGSCDYISPYFNLTGLQQPEVSFYLYFSDIDAMANAKLYVGIIPVVDGVSQDITIVSEPISNYGEPGWQKVTVSLADYADCERAAIVLRGTNNQKGSIHIDKIAIEGNHPDHDARIMSFTGPKNAVMGRDNIYTAAIHNNGQFDAEAALVEFFADDELVSSKTVSIASGETANVEFAFKPAITESESALTLTATVTLAGDANDANNSLSTNVAVLCPALPYVPEITASVQNGNVHLAWNEASVYPATITVRDDFESYSDFAISGFGDWTTVDVDGVMSLPAIGSSMGSFTWQNAGTPQAYIVFNPGKVGITQLATAHSGEKCLVAFVAAQQNDDWLISPLLCGTMQTISFYAKAMYPGNLDEVFEILYSTTGKDTKDFTRIGEPNTIGTTNWRRYSFDIPAGARYFAIRCISNDQFGLMIDDIEYQPAQSSVELWGYNVYRNDERIAEEHGLTTYVDSEADLSETNHYHVSAVYDEGESIFSAKAIVEPTAIDGIGAAAVEVYTAGGQIIVKGATDRHLAVFAADGRTLYSFTASASEHLDVAAGVYVVTVDSTSYKVIVK